MRFFRSNEPMSVEDEAAAMRLMAVASRTRAAQSADREPWHDVPADEAQAQEQPR